jgi:hypothetical protein
MTHWMKLTTIAVAALGVGASAQAQQRQGGSNPQAQQRQGGSNPQAQQRQGGSNPQAQQRQGGPNPQAQHGGLGDSIIIRPDGQVIWSPYTYTPYGPVYDPYGFLGHQVWYPYYPYPYYPYPYYPGVRGDGGVPQSRIQRPQEVKQRNDEKIRPLKGSGTAPDHQGGRGSEGPLGLPRRVGPARPAGPPHLRPEGQDAHPGGAAL